MEPSRYGPGLCSARQSAYSIGQTRLAVGQPGFGLERHGQPRRVAGGLDRDQRVLQVAIPSRMRQPDITGTEGVAQMEQDRDLPYSVLIVSIQMAMPL